MNEIEKAIEFLGYVKGYDIQSVNLAVEALREKADAWCIATCRNAVTRYHFKEATNATR